MPSVSDDVVEVITIMTIFSLPTVLSYPMTRVVVGQAPIAAARGCCFTLSSFFPDRSIGYNQRACLMVSG
jgi:hypothetical protein